MAKKKTTPQVREAAAEMSALIPRFATSIASHARDDHFIFDFLYGVGEQTPILLGRYAVSPDHAKRLRDLLTRQIKLYDEGQAAAKKTPAKKPMKKSAKKTTKKKSTKKATRPSATPRP